MSQPQEFLKRINAALALRDIPDYPAALDQLKKALELNPEDASVHLLLGLTYQELELLENAENSLRHAYEIDPGSLEINQSYGILLSRIRKNHDAIKLLQPLFEADPKNSVISRGLASSLWRENKIDEAIQVLNTTLIHTNDIGAILDLTELYNKKGKYESAEKVLLDYLQSDLSPKVLSRLGNLYLDQKNYEKAVLSFNKAVSIKEDIESAWVGLTRSYLEQGNLGCALDVVESGIVKRPASRKLFQLKGEVLFLQKKKEEALLAYDRAIELSKSTGDAFDLGLLLFLRDKKVLSTFGGKEALELIDGDIKTTSGFPLLVSLKAGILVDQKKFKQAIKFIEVLDPKKYEELLFPDYYLALMGIGDYDRASDELRKAIENPNFKRKDDLLDLIENEGVKLFSNGEVGKSRQVYEQVLQLMPNRARSLNNLAFLLISAHEWEYGLDLLNQAQRNDYLDLGVLLTNRGYVYLCKGLYGTAIEILQDALGYSEDIDDEAYLHIAYTLDGRLTFSEGDDYPERSISIRLAINANLATAYYLNGEIEKAFICADEAVDIKPDDNIGYRLLGNLHYLEGHFELAEKSWRKALRSFRSKKEAKIIKEKLASLIDREIK